MGELYAKMHVKGVVQGVGFRPFIWTLANSFSLFGWVLNDAKGVTICLKSASTSDEIRFKQTLDLFWVAIQKNPPPLAQIDSVEQGVLTRDEARRLQHADQFVIITSEDKGMNTAVLADAATCNACLSELKDPSNRRYGYAFINCTHCGPRYSIIRNMPYDRKETSMASFSMCTPCLEEYQTPSNRRFHAQPNACSKCGPLLSFSVRQPTSWQTLYLTQTQIIEHAVQRLEQGDILAVKGIGGVHLVCDATNTNACTLLRERKKRPDKPFALMAHAVSNITPYVQVSEVAITWLSSVESPVVLLPKVKKYSEHYPLSRAVAPEQNRLGFMLPSNPIHHLLLAAWQKASVHGVLVFTSANLSGEPQIFQDEVAQTDLLRLADAYVSHNREIVRRLEDSVVSLLPNQKSYLVLRQARGFSPYRMRLPRGLESQAMQIAAGADLKSSVAICKGKEVVLSQYLGDLSSLAAQEAYQQTWNDFIQLYQCLPNQVLHDRHLAYYSTQFVQQTSPPSLSVVSVQHHHAHFNACLLENQVPFDGSKQLGIILDGLGAGLDNTLWGGEFLYGNYESVQRVAHLNSRPLLGGDKANQEPWRNLLAQLLTLGSWSDLSLEYASVVTVKKLNDKPIALLQQALSSGIQTPLSSSTGRLFDAVAALCDLCFERNTYEGQAAMSLEALLTEERIQANMAYAYTLSVDTSQEVWQLQTTSIFKQMLEDLKYGLSIEDLSARFHIGFAHSLVNMALQLKRKYPFKQLVLSGGVCQNGWLMQLISEKLPNDIVLCLHKNTPANDQSIAVGQMAIGMFIEVKNG